MRSNIDAYTYKHVHQRNSFDSHNIDNILPILTFVDQKESYTKTIVKSVRVCKEKINTLYACNKNALNKYLG